MSEYERCLKTEYEIAGYKFLYDDVATHPSEAAKKAAHTLGIPMEKVLVVLGDCIDGAAGCSRMLVFEEE